MAWLTLDGQRIAPGTLVLTRPWAQELALCWTTTSGAPTAVELDGVPLGPTAPGAKHFPLPRLAGELTWREGGQLRRRRIDVPGKTRPPVPEQELLRQLRAELQDRGVSRPLTLADLDTLPMVPLGAMLDALESTPLDEYLATRGLGAIQRIARRPRSHLRREDALVPVERLRRLSRRAERNLERQQDVFFDGSRPMPSRLLATFIEEELDLYENRVVASLVDRLFQRASRRLARLDTALQRLQHLQDSIDRAFQLGQYRRHGLLRKELQDARADKLDDLLRAAEQTRAQLESQVRACLAFQASALGRALRRAPLVPWPPRDTNILTFDADYETAVRTWGLFEDERRREVQLDPWQRELDASYADFCLFLLLRALLRCRYTPDQPDTAVPLQPGQTAPHRSTWRYGSRWTLDVRRTRDAIELDIWDEVRRKGDKAAGRRPQPRTRLALHPTFTPQVQARPAQSEARQAVWLHPVDVLPDDYGAAQAYLSFDEAPTPAGARAPLALPVAPGAFQAEDRLGRLIRRFTTWVELTEDNVVPGTCPACGGPGRRTRGEDHCCKDAQCGTRWGRRRCGCGAWIPKVLPPQPRQDVLDDQIQDHWAGGRRLALVTDMGGRDLLASWCLHSEGIGGDMLICPSCGDCGRQGCGGGGACGRCG